MKLLIDLIGCQTDSRYRGIGRYIHSLTVNLIKNSKNQVILLANPIFSESYEQLRQEFIRLVPPGCFLPYYHTYLDWNSNEKNIRREVAETLVQQTYQIVSPDVILYPSLFEGWQKAGAVALPMPNYPNAKRVGIIYDFIPLLFPQLYFSKNPSFEQYYHSIVAQIKNFDLLLAISESTRQDALKLIGLAPEKVVNISSAADPIFQKLDIENELANEFNQRMGITRPFVLYIGGNNPRKNMEEALRAYADLPIDIRKGHQLVLNDIGDQAEFKKKAGELGLSDDETVVTGYITDSDLIYLYNLCKVFVYPSLYEGFGLPVLEAMACGAPVIASSNSSLPEVIGRSDALFDGSDRKQITAALLHVLTDEAFRLDLKEYGLDNAKKFSWQFSANRTWDAISSIDKKKHTFKINTATKKRIAYLSPLPPQKSGISDYSADLLPYLSHHFDLDLFVEPNIKISNLNLNCDYSIHPWSSLSERRKNYSTFVYQIGNSEFHIHMLDLLKKNPGVVVLHDFYLSHLVTAIYYLYKKQDSFYHFLNESHGLRGILDFQKNGSEHARVMWPMNWTVLKHAQELIVHSGYQIQLIEKYYQNGWHPNPTVIPQIRREVPIIGTEKKQEIRSLLSIQSSDFIFCSFGFIASTKLSHIIIHAFAQLRSRINTPAKLILVGQLDQGEYGQKILDLLKEYGLQDIVRITGFVSKEDFEKYLIAGDAAIQLRTNSRGETSRAVLDCMANGLPVILNAHGSMDDYDTNDVIKLSDPPQVDDLSDAMISVLKNEAYRLEKSEKSRRYIRDYHNPERIAEQYAEVIHSAIHSDERTLFEPLGRSISKSRNPDELLHAASSCAAMNMQLRSQPRLLIDVTDLASIDYRGGIQRVVKNIIRELSEINAPSFCYELVRLKNGKLYRASRLVEVLFSLPVDSIGVENTITVNPGDTLLMLDSSWSLYQQFIPIYETIRRNGGRIISVVYDIIPLRFPETCSSGVLEVFDQWFHMAIAQSDQLICISRAVADDVLTYVHEQNLPLTRQLDISYFHLGADIHIVDQESTTRSQVQELTKKDNSPLFLMVGTLEPRKGHAYVLDAFDLLWRQGIDVQLCISGKLGWNTDEIKGRIQKHSEIGKRLIFIENPTDSEIDQCYQSATALIMASQSEGFGLPIIEAAFHNIPAIVSDIPVFHEVGGDGVLYFSLESPTCLADAVLKMAEIPIENRHEMARRIKALTWKESVSMLMEVLRNNNVYKTLIPGNFQGI